MTPVQLPEVPAPTFGVKWEMVGREYVPTDYAAHIAEHGAMPPAPLPGHWEYRWQATIITQTECSEQPSMDDLLAAITQPEQNSGR